MFKLFRKLEHGEKIIIGADPADGGTNYCAAQCYSTRHRDVPLVFHARMEATQFGHELYKLAIYIHEMTGEWPLIAVEKNTGSATLYVLQTYNYTHLFRMPKDINDPKKKNEETDTLGWVTNKTTRISILDGLSLTIRQRAIKIYDAQTVRELMTFVLGYTGKPQAAYGCFDDLVLSLAIALKVAEISPKAKTINREAMAARAAMFPKDDVAAIQEM